MAHFIRNVLQDVTIFCEYLNPHRKCTLPYTPSPGTPFTNVEEVDGHCDCLILDHLRLVQRFQHQQVGSLGLRREAVGIGVGIDVVSGKNGGKLD